MSQAKAWVPVNTAPLIRFSRWSLLLLGIWYGSTRWNYLHRKEEKYRAHLLEMKPQMDAEAALRKKEAEQREMAELKKQGIDLGGQ